ncbi:MAG: amidohydrolase family protein [Solirubrobacterales bacterium]
MMIDFHVHIGSKDTWYEGNIVMARQFQETNSFQKLLDDDDEVSVDKYIAYMDRLGIAYSVVMTTIETVDFVEKKCAQSNRLLPFFTFNPHFTFRPELDVEHAMTERGFKGIKLYPTYWQFYPNEPRLYPVYAKAQELDVPVMFHTGSSTFPGSRMKYGNPLYMDDLAVDFPDLKIVLAHAGRGFWYDEAFFLSRLHRNVYLEVSGLPVKKLLQYFPDFEKNGDKILFGSDWPASPGPEKMLDDFGQLPISEETKRKILGQNAARLLKLNPAKP